MYGVVIMVFRGSVKCPLVDQRHSDINSINVGTKFKLLQVNKQVNKTYLGMGKSYRNSKNQNRSTIVGRYGGLDGNNESITRPKSSLKHL